MTRVDLQQYLNKLLSELPLDRYLERRFTTASETGGIPVDMDLGFRGMLRDREPKLADTLKHSKCVWQLLLAHFGGLIWPTLGRCRLGKAFALPSRKNKDRRSSCGNVRIPPLGRDSQGRSEECETVNCGRCIISFFANTAEITVRIMSSNWKLKSIT